MSVPQCGSQLYKILSRKSNKVWDVRGESHQDGAQIIQYDYHGGTNQHWHFKNGHIKNSYHIMSHSTGKAVEIPAGGGTKLSQGSLHGGTNQSFLLEPVDGGYFRIRSLHTKKVLDVEGESYNNSAAIIQWDCHDHHNQHWAIIPV